MKTAATQTINPILNADLIAKFHQVWRLRIRREARAWALGLSSTPYDRRLELTLHNLCTAYPADIAGIRATFDHEGELDAAERAAAKAEVAEVAAGRLSEVIR